MKTILYVSDTDQSADFGAEVVWHAETVHEALGMYVLYHPAVVLLDARSVVARLVFEHLSDVATSSPYGLTALLVVHAGERVWETPEGAILWCAAGAADDDLIDDLLAERDVMLREGIGAA